MSEEFNETELNGVDPAYLEPNFSQFNALNIIQKPTNPNWVKKKQGLDYVSGDTVIRMLNKAFNYRWSYYIMDSRVVSSQDKYDKYKKESVSQGAVVQVHGRLVVPGWGVREQWGSQPLIGGSDVQEHAFKSAATDAMKKCASMFGIALDLYGQDGAADLMVGTNDYLVDDKKLLENIKDQMRKQHEAAHQQQETETAPKPETPAEQVEPQEYHAEPDLAQAASNPAPPVPTQEPAQQMSQPAPEQVQQVAQEVVQQQQQQQQPVQEVPQQPTQPEVAQPEQQSVAPMPASKTWQAEDINGLKQFKKDRGIINNNDLDGFVQEFLNMPEATYYNITPENIKDFLTFLATK